MSSIIVVSSDCNSFIQTTMQSGQTYIYNIDSVNYGIPSCKVPNSIFDIDYLRNESSQFIITYAAPKNFPNGLDITGQKGILINQNDETKNYVVYHEYGHYLLFQIYDAINKIASEVGKNNVGKFPACRGDYTHSLAHPVGCKELAFNEGWATAYSSAVRETAMYGNFDQIERNDYPEREDTLTWEFTTASILWDIMDKNGDFPLTVYDDDSINNEFSKVWNILKEDQPVDILEFYNDWISRDYKYTQYKNELYDIYKMQGIDKLLNDWSYQCHDQKRTCHSSMSSDIYSSNSDQIGWQNSEFLGTYDNPIMADVIDNDGVYNSGQLFLSKRSEILVTSEDAAENGYVYMLTNTEPAGKEPKFEKVWSKVVSGISEAPLVSNLDGAGNKEIVFITEKGDFYILDAKTGKLVYTITILDGTDHGNVAAADIDNNGIEEVLFAGSKLDQEVQSYLWIFNISNEDLEAVPLDSGSRGAWYAISIADLDNNGYFDIVVPGYYGVQIFEFNPSTGQVELKANNSDGRLVGPVVIYDIDKDGDYELIYSTTDYNCASGKTCTRSIYVKDKDLNTEYWQPLTYYPRLNPSIANMSGDSKFEILQLVTTGGSVFDNSGYVKCFDSSLNDCSGWSSTGPYDINFVGPTTFDVDGKGKNEVLMVGDNGILYSLANNGNEYWEKNMGGTIVSDPAIGDWDGDGKAEIAIKHYESGQQSLMATAMNFAPNSLTDKEASSLGLKPLKRFDPEYYSVSQNGIVSYAYVPMDSVNIMSILDGLNKQPILSQIESQQYFIADDNITIDAEATDLNNDTLTYYFSSPFNQSETLGYWQTNSSNTGTYEILVSASDGNLSDSQYVVVNVYRNDTQKLTSFSDSTETKQFNFTSDEMTTHSTSITLSNMSRIWHADLKFSGSPLATYYSSFQEVGPVVVEANQINTSIISNLVDKNWSSYYSAGSLTGAIVELQNNSIPTEIGHIVFHIKIRHDNNGNGRFGVYNYNQEYYEIVTSTIPVTNSSVELYFDIYNISDSALWTGNSTHYSMAVSDINDYINQSNDAVRWYYRYINGNYSNQLIYESEVKFVEPQHYPKDLVVKVGDSVIMNATGSVIDNSIKLTEFSDKTKNKTFMLSNSSSVAYIKIPKKAVIEYAYLGFGNHTTTDLNMTLFLIKELPEGNEINILISSDYDSSSESLGGENKNTEINISYLKNNSSQFYEAESTWGGGCYYEPEDNYILRVETWFDKEDYYWDYDEGKQTLIVGNDLEIRSMCDYATPGTYALKSMKQDTDDRNGESNYDQSWSGSDSSGTRFMYYTYTPSKTGGDVWGLGYTYCKVEDDYENWFDAWSSNDCSDQDSTSNREGFYIQNCLYRGKKYSDSQDYYHIGCAADKRCDDSGSGTSNSCVTPICNPACDEWEHDTYANHACSCALDAGRCDYSQYGWQNVADNQYCGSNHYPNSTQTINCSIYETWSIVNHIETCTLTTGRCNTSNVQLDSKYYCSADYWIREIEVFVNINGISTEVVKKSDVIEVDISNELQDFLSVCEADGESNCLVPLNFSSDYNASFEIKSVTINYGIQRLDFTSELQNNLLNQCSGICNLSLSVLSSDGTININQLRNFKSPESQPVLQEMEMVEAKEGDNVVITAFDQDIDDLIILSSMPQFYQNGSSIVWETNSSDTGNYYLHVNVSDGLMMDFKNYIIKVGSVPNIIDSNIWPANPNDDDSLIGACNATDTENDRIGYFWKLYKNDILYKEGDTANHITKFDFNESYLNISANTTRNITLPLNTTILKTNLSIEWVGYSMCYQESSNISNSCGGISEGYYNFTNNFNDGDYDTAIFDYTNMRFTYKKPLGSTSNSLLQLKYQIGCNVEVPTIENISLTSCYDLNSTYISFRTEALPNGAGIILKCNEQSIKLWNFTGHICGGFWSRKLYEEGMQWDMSNVVIKLNNITLFDQAGNNSAQKYTTFTSELQLCNNYYPTCLMQFVLGSLANVSIKELSILHSLTYQGTKINVTNISSAETVDGDKWVLSCMASDGLFDSDWMNSTPVYIGGGPTSLNILSITDLYNDSLNNKLFEIKIMNNGTQDVSNINWSLDTGSGLIEPDVLFNLSVGQKAILYIDYTYSSAGNYNITVNLFNGTLNFSKTANVSVAYKEVYIESLSVVKNNNLNVTYEFVIKNSLSESLSNIYWNFIQGDTSQINSSIPINLSSQGKGYVYIDYIYATNGTYTAVANVTYNGVTDTKNITITI